MEDQFVPEPTRPVVAPAAVQAPAPTPTPAPAYLRPAQSSQLPSPYAGPDRRVALGPHHPPQGVTERRRLTPPPAPPRIQMRAKFVVSDITHTTRGVTVLNLKAEYDADEKNKLAPGNSPVGSLSIEVNPDWAAKSATHGSVFYLYSV